MGQDKVKDDAQDSCVLPLFAIVGITVALFTPALGLNFNPACDDIHYILQNPSIKDSSLNGLLTVLSSRTPHYVVYEPVTFVSYWANYALFGMNPTGYFATQILLHALNVVLVFLVLKAITGDTTISLLSAAIFGIHPYQVDTVAMLDQRENLLNTLFGLLSLRCYVFWQAERAAIAYAASIAFFALALLCDAPWVVLPMLLILVDYCRTGQVWPRSVYDKVPFFCMAAVFSVVTVKLTSQAGMVTPYHFGSLGGQIFLAIQLFADYVVSFFLPWGLSPAYTYNPADMLSLKTLLSALFLCAAVFLAVVGFKKDRRELVLGIGWYAVCFLPISQAIPIMIVRADQFMYHSLIGLALVAVSGIVALVGTERATRLRLLLVCALAACLVPVTLNHFKHYVTPFAYIDRFVETQGWAASAEVLRARVYGFRGDYLSEAQALEKAIPQYDDPLASQLRIRAAVSYLRLGMMDRASDLLARVPADSAHRNEADHWMGIIRSRRPGVQNTP